MSSASDRVLGETSDIPNVMEVHSSVLEPIIVTNTQARWVLENKGILSRDSVLQFQLTVPAAQSGKAYLPVGAGIYSLIKSATLRIGATRINNIQDLAFMKTMTHSYDTPSYRTNVTRVLKGINNALVPCPVASNNSAGGTFVPSGSTFSAKEGHCGLDYQNLLTSSADTTPCWSIRLAELFPVLYEIELPLFLLNDEVAIDLTFRTQVAQDRATGGVGTLCCFFDSGAASPANMVLESCELVKNTCLLYLDTITYADERQEQIAASMNAKDGMFLDYTDVIQNVANIPSAPAITTAGEAAMTTISKTNQVPLSGFRVKNLFWGYNVPDWTPLTNPATNVATYRYYNELYGKYALEAYREDDTWDIRVNDVLAFPQPVKSATLKAAEAENVYGSPVWLNQALYSYNAVSSKGGLYPLPATSALLPTSVQFEAWGEHTNLSVMTGKNHFSAVNLSHGWGDENDDSVLIDQKPIEVQHRVLPVNSETNYNRNAYYYAEVVKRFGILDGKARVFQQPAVQTSRQ